MMMTIVSVQHTSEVQRGERFEFGKNWRRFLSTLTDKRIAVAEQSLQKFLNMDRLDGKTFLDVGSGSGLFSLAARRLGASVRSFDYDPNSVACTNELRRRYFPSDESWLVEQGSVLDRGFLASLGEFDIVYSWGVLHHTGAMWQALDNVKPLARLGGQLFIAIYNDLGVVTDRWRAIKKTYNQFPSVFRLPFAVGIIAVHEAPAIVNAFRNKDLHSYFRTWTEYARTSTRGMSRWHDWIDWIGGYPYECATVEAIVDYFAKDGFVLERLESRASGTGCNEFVFRRKANLGVFIDSLIPKSRSLLRQYGRRVHGPFSRIEAGYVANVPEALRSTPTDSLVLFRNGNLVGAMAAGLDAGSIVIAPPDWTAEAVNAARIELVQGSVRPIGAPIRHYSGFMYGTSVPDLTPLADNSTQSGDTSPVFVFEGQEQLGLPHSIHEEIVRHGGGRFSHWGQEVLFSSSDNSDPRTNGRMYRLVIAERDAAH
jgi:2-polyprenyl-3-methyl-5-hydroxy-6-metoxy-1,4-benzoquinol methylase